MEPVVEVAQGRLRGAREDGVLAFRGVPYAAPPRRFHPPEPAERWDGVRDANAFGPICPQNPSGLEQLLGRREPPPQDEDCLTLNVWTSSLEGARPVMVWIHGGSFATGSGRVPWYDGSAFARSGVVLVTINYRLGPLGFCHLPDVAGSGVAGILDQAMALRWVRENVAAFGGDPSNVTVFGESAGGMSVGALLALPSARGAFDKAIAQSGAAHHAVDAELAARITERFSREVGTDIRTAPVDGLLRAAAALSAVDPRELFGEATGLSMPFQPVVDGDVLPRRPIDAVRDGAAAEVPLLVGTTADEWTLFGMGTDETSAERALAAGPADLVAAYRADRPDATALAVRTAIETDRIFRIPAVRLAEAQLAHGAPVWMYLFAWCTPALGGRLGATHALEIPFVFDNLDAPGVPLLCGEGPPRSLSAAMHRAWVSFAASGDPNHDGLPHWPRYEPSRRPTMVFDATCRVELDPRGEERRRWEGRL